MHIGRVNIYSNYSLKGSQNPTTYLERESGRLHLGVIEIASVDTFKSILGRMFPDLYC